MMLQALSIHFDVYILHSVQFCSFTRHLQTYYHIFYSAHKKTNCEN